MDAPSITFTLAQASCSKQFTARAKRGSLAKGLFIKAALMQNLEQFINDSESSDLDHLVKMAIVHHQFESIHPFYDGNGRTGRIINILYLVKEDLLTLPILYLSRYINQHKAEYYRLLQQTRQTQDWEPWLLFMLEGVAQTAQQTTQMILDIKAQMQDVKQVMRSRLPKIYSQDLLNNLFNHPYTKIEFVMNDLLLSKPTAIKYLDALIEVGILQKHKIGRETYYINQQLFEIIMNVPKLHRKPPFSIHVLKTSKQNPTFLYLFSTPQTIISFEEYGKLRPVVRTPKSRNQSRKD